MVVRKGQVGGREEGAEMQGESRGNRERYAPVCHQISYIRSMHFSSINLPENQISHVGLGTGWVTIYTVGLNIEARLYWDCLQS